MKKFNTTGPCIPERHYMVDISEQMEYIHMLVEEGAYFTINRARQYGKTTTLALAAEVISEDYLVISMDFQKFSQSCFESESRFSRSFAAGFCDEAGCAWTDGIRQPAFHALQDLEHDVQADLHKLFRLLLKYCEISTKPVVLMIDEVDSAADNQVFIDFLSQLRSSYLDRNLKGRAAFWSVILSGVYDVKNIKRKIHGNTSHMVNSPWNIAADFDINMSFTAEGIAGMLSEYEADHCTGMDIFEMSTLIYDYTCGYPFLVSRLCRLIDEKAGRTGSFGSKRSAWTKTGFYEAVRLILTEKNSLFDSLTGKLAEYPVLNEMIYSLLFAGKSIAYNPDDEAVDMAEMFGFVKPMDGNVVLANRIFETRLYNYFLSESAVQNTSIYKAALHDKNQFVQNGRLNMEMVLEKFVRHFEELFGDRGETFYEEDGRRYFLLYLKPIINGTGNYYVESRTRNMERTDVIVDYNGEQFVVEMKIWRGPSYHERGEQQLAEYLEHYHLKKGYMLSFSFNKKKKAGVWHIPVGNKVLVEAVV